MFLSANQTQAAELNFSVEPVIPDNQMDKGKTYFNLKMEPEQEQTLEVVLTNDTEEDITVDVGINQAVTNNNGIIDYNQQPDEYDESLQYLIDDIVDYEDEVVIEAENEVTYPIKINMPGDTIEGMVLAGIHFQEQEDEDNEEDKEGLENKFAYTVGLQLEMEEEDIKSDLKLHDINPTQVNYRNVVTVNLQNPEAKRVCQVFTGAVLTVRFGLFFKIYPNVVFYRLPLQADAFRGHGLGLLARKEHSLRGPRTRAVPAGVAVIRSR